MIRHVTAAVAGTALFATFTLASAGPAPDATGTATQPNLKVAFLGDQGLGAGAEAVLRLIRDDGADAVVHMGDFDYVDNPDAWDAQITMILGSSFPYLASLGGSEVVAAAGYQRKLEARYARVPDLTCSGETAVQQSCDFRGLQVILTAPGDLGSEHAAYIRDRLAESDAIWRVCAWHRNMTPMQTGARKGPPWARRLAAAVGLISETGWGVYEECRLGGGIIVTASEHSYARSYLFKDIDTQQFDPKTGSEMTIDKGQTLVIVSGLGGRTIRDQDRYDPWWAGVWNTDTDGDFGAFFCEFNVGGRPENASCYFKDIQGRIADRFTLTSAVGSGS